MANTYNGSHQLFNLANGLVELLPPSGRNIELSPTDGNASIGEISAGGRAANIVRNRGLPIGMTEGDSQEVSFTITCKHAGAFTDPVQALLLDAVLQTGSYGAETTRDPAGVVFTSNIKLTVVRNALAGYITLYNVRCSLAYAEDAVANTITINGTAYGYTSGGVYTQPVVYS